MRSPPARSGQLVHARSFRTRYLVPRDHPAPDRLRARLDAISTTNFRDALVRTLRQYIDGPDDTIWFIKRIDLDVSLNAGWDADRVARVWASHVARALVQAIESGQDRDEIVRFANRAAYVAQFLSDVVEGIAWSRWYYHEYHGLRMVPVSSVMRTVLCEDITRGWDALIALEGKVGRVISVLSNQDAKQVLDAISVDTSATKRSMLLDQAWTMYRKQASYMDLSDDSHGVLRLCLEVTRAYNTSAGQALVQAARALLRLKTVIGTHPEVASILRAPRYTGGMASLYTVAAAHDVEALAPLLEADAEWRTTVIDTLRRQESTTSTSAGSGEFIVRQTPFGGAFLLFPILNDLPCDEIARTWHAACETPASAVLRLVILAKCLGGTCLPRLLLDPVMRDLLAIHPQTTMRDVASWYDALTRAQLAEVVHRMGSWIRSRQGIAAPAEIPDASSRNVLNREYLSLGDGITESLSASRAIGMAAYGVLTMFARKLPGFSQSSFPYLRANFLDIAAILEEEPARRVVRLERPPLDLLLSMTGMSRATYRMSWLDERPFTLFPGGQL